MTTFQRPPPAGGHLRIEVFPQSQSTSLDFYIRVLRFTQPPPHPVPASVAAEAEETAKKEKEEDEEEVPYTFIKRGSIFIGMATFSPKHYDPLVQNFQSRYKQRPPPLGTEHVFVLPTLEDLHAEREHILGQGWVLEEDLVLRKWGLWDFRLKDPDGYYWRFTTEYPQ